MQRQVRCIGTGLDIDHQIIGAPVLHGNGSNIGSRTANNQEVGADADDTHSDHGSRNSNRQLFAFATLFLLRCSGGWGSGGYLFGRVRGVGCRKGRHIRQLRELAEQRVFRRILRRGRCDLDILFTALHGGVRHEAGNKLLVHLVRFRKLYRLHFLIHGIGMDNVLRVQQQRRHNQRVRDVVALHIEDQVLHKVLRRLVAVLRQEGTGLHNDFCQLVIAVQRRRQRFAGNPQFVGGLGRGFLIFKGTVVAVENPVQHHANRININGGVERIENIGHFRCCVLRYHPFRHGAVFELRNFGHTQVAQHKAVETVEIDVFRFDIPVNQSVGPQIAEGRTQVQSQIQGLQMGHGVFRQIFHQRLPFFRQQIQIVTDAVLFFTDLIVQVCCKIGAAPQHIQLRQLGAVILDELLKVFFCLFLILSRTGEVQGLHLGLGLGHGNPFQNVFLTVQRAA